MAIIPLLHKDGLTNSTKVVFQVFFDKEKPGRPASLNERQWEKLGRDLRKQPKTFGYFQNLWDGKLLANHLKSQNGIIVGIRHCQRIFQKFGFRMRKPQLGMAQADQSAQKAIRKTRKGAKNTINEIWSLDEGHF